jgi:hypothetical protein
MKWKDLCCSLPSSVKQVYLELREHPLVPHADGHEDQLMMYAASCLRSVGKQSDLTFIHQPSSNYGQLGIYGTARVFVMSDITEKVVRKYERRKRDKEGTINKGKGDKSGKKEK